MSTAAVLRRFRVTTRLLRPKLTLLLRLIRATALRLSALWVLLFSPCRELSLHFFLFVIGHWSFFSFSSRSKHSIVLALLGVLFRWSVSSSIIIIIALSIPCHRLRLSRLLFLFSWTATSWTKHAKEARAQRGATKRPSLVSCFFFGNLTKLHDSLYQLFLYKKYMQDTLHYSQDRFFPFSSSLSNLFSSISLQILNQD